MTKVALAVRGDKTLAEQAQQHDVRPNQIIDWKNKLLARRCRRIWRRTTSGRGASRSEGAARQDQPAGPRE